MHPNPDAFDCQPIFYFLSLTSTLDCAFFPSTLLPKIPSSQDIVLVETSFVNISLSPCIRLQYQGLVATVFLTPVGVLHYSVHT